MKEYGSKKATEFTRKQIGVIYGMAKSGKLSVEKWVMSDLYNLADYYGYDDNGSVAESEKKVLEILEAVFGNETEKAQELIDKYTEKTFELLSRKNRENADRTRV